MSRRQRRDASPHSISKPSTEKYRRSLLARAYALILAPDWEQLTRQHFGPTLADIPTGSCATSPEKAETEE